ncbi:MAG: hypothetical protein LQ338_005524 [Usnochroma carphineum]|nr:MAG: hypothetical protein LQ338_005524 [Usnochroma carphineum]
MTDSLRAPIDSLNYNDTHYTYFTAPSPSPASINNLTDAAASAAACRDTLTLHGNIYNLNNYDAVLVACYSPHPLIPEIQKWGETFPCTGIFEASILASLQLLSPGKNQKFGIVSTGLQWAGILGDAITAPAGTSGAALGGEMAGRWFAGVECVGVSAGELHPSEDGDEEGGGGDDEAGRVEGNGGIKDKVMAATGRLLDRGDMGVVILGCAGMVGMEEWVREEVGRRGLQGVRVVDGVKAGVSVLQGILRADYEGRGRGRRTTGTGMGRERVMRMEVQPRSEEYERQLSSLGEENERRLGDAKRRKRDDGD